MFGKPSQDCDFDVPKVYAMYKDNTPTSTSFEQPGTGCFNLVMEDLNLKWSPYSTLPGKTPTLEQHRVSMQKFKSMHVKFFVSNP